jgi:hypothetical protein
MRIKLVIDGQLNCSRCKLNKPVDCFGKSNEYQSGYRGTCRDCVNERQRGRYKNKGSPRASWIARTEFSRRTKFAKTKATVRQKTVVARGIDCVEALESITDDFEDRLFAGSYAGAA